MCGAPRNRAGRPLRSARMLLSLRHPLFRPTTMAYPYNLAFAAGLMLIVLSCGLALVLT
jgi:hypothetical protein